MKNLLILSFLVLCFGCSSLKLTNTEYNKESSVQRLNKVLVIGVTPDDELRREFEFKFVQQLQKRNVTALQSAVVFKSLFKDAAQTEAELLQQIEILKSNGYDTVLLTLVKGIEENTSYSGENVKMDYYLRQYLVYSLMYRDASYDRQTYDDYKVYHFQSTIYNLKTKTEMTMVWAGNYDFINPKKSSKTINKYINAVMKSLEKEQLIVKK